MEHLSALKHHPHRELVAAGLGAAALLALYACYKCCHRRCEAKQKSFASSERSSKNEKSVIVTGERRSSAEKAEGEAQETGGKPSCLAPQSSYPAPQSNCPPRPQLPKDAAKPNADDKAARVCAICEQYLPQGAAATQGDKSAPDSKRSSAEEGKDGKPYVDGNKYLPTVHPPANLVCPPAHVGISAFMDTRPQFSMPRVFSNARSYVNDRYYRGSTYALPLPCPAYLHASKCPLPRLRTKRSQARPGKMLRAKNIARR